MSRQSEEQKRLRREGRCARCWQPSPEGRALCPQCSIKARNYQRKKRGYRPQTETRRGRPLKYPEHPTVLDTGLPVHSSQTQKAAADALPA
jgi:hypothetical protein